MEFLPNTILTLSYLFKFLLYVLFQFAKQNYLKNRSIEKNSQMLQVSWHDL